MSGIFIIGVLVADGLGISVSPNLRIEPSSGIFTAGFARQRQSPLAKPFFEEHIVETGQISHLPDTKCMQVLLGNFAHAGNVPYIERRQKSCFLARHNPQNSIGLGFG